MDNSGSSDWGSYNPESGKKDLETGTEDADAMRRETERDLLALVHDETGDMVTDVTALDDEFHLGTGAEPIEAEFDFEDLENSLLEPELEITPEEMADMDRVGQSTLDTRSDSESSGDAATPSREIFRSDSGSSGDEDSIDDELLTRFFDSE